LKAEAPSIVRQVASSSADLQRHTASIVVYSVSYYYYYKLFTASWTLSGTTRVSRYQKGKTRKVKTNLDLRHRHRTVAYAMARCSAAAIYILLLKRSKHLQLVRIVGLYVLPVNF